MSGGEIRLAKNASKKSRRRKKRRTVDISDTSSSDSSSDAESGKETTVVDEIAEEDIVLTDNELIVEENVVNNTNDRETMDNDTREKLSTIPFTTTELTERNDHKRGQPADLVKVQQKLDEDKQILATEMERQTNDKDATQAKNEYLNLIFENYGEDISSLREAPDFTNKSLVILANVLKDGAGMFDVETLKTILN